MEPPHEQNIKAPEKGRWYRIVYRFALDQTPIRAEWDGMNFHTSELPNVPNAGLLSLDEVASWEPE